MKINRYNPFERFSDKSLLCFGLIFTIIGSMLGFFFKGRFDGVLDIHFVNSIEWYQPFLDNTLNISVITIVLFILGKILNKKTRLLDVLNAVMLSRICIYVLVFFNINDFISQISEMILDDLPQINFDLNFALLIFFGLLSLFIIVIYLIIMYMGFKVAVNSKKNIHTLYFVFAIILVEIFTKIVYYLNNI